MIRVQASQKEADLIESINASIARCDHEHEREKLVADLDVAIGKLMQKQDLEHHSLRGSSSSFEDDEFTRVNTPEVEITEAIIEKEQAKHEVTVWVSRPDSPGTTDKKGRNPFGDHPNPLRSNPVDFAAIPNSAAKDNKGKGKEIESIPLVDLTRLQVPAIKYGTGKDTKGKGRARDETTVPNGKGSVPVQDTHSRFVGLSKADSDKVLAHKDGPDAFRFTDWTSEGSNEHHDFFGAEDDAPAFPKHYYRVLQATFEYYIHGRIYEDIDGYTSNHCTGYGDGIMKFIIPRGTPLRTALNRLYHSPYPTASEKATLRSHGRAYAIVRAHVRDGAVMDRKYMYAHGLDAFAGDVKALLERPIRLRDEEDARVRRGLRLRAREAAAKKRVVDEKECMRGEKTYADFCRELAVGR